MRTVKTLEEIKAEKGTFYVGNLAQIVTIKDLRSFILMGTTLPWVAYPLSNGKYAVTEVG